MLTEMASIECERCGRTEPPIKYIKNLPTPKKQDIALFFHSSTRTSMACQKNFLNQWLQHARLLHVMLLSLVLVTCEDLFFRDTIILGQK